MGDTDCTVVSNVAEKPEPPFTRLPTVTNLLLTRPSMGDNTLHHSKFKRATSSAAVAPATAALFCETTAAALSTSCCDTAPAVPFFSPDRRPNVTLAIDSAASAFCRSAILEPYSAL